MSIADPLPSSTPFRQAGGRSLALTPNPAQEEPMRHHRPVQCHEGAGAARLACPAVRKSRSGAMGWSGGAKERGRHCGVVRLGESSSRAGQARTRHPRSCGQRRLRSCDWARWMIAELVDVGIEWASSGVGSDEIPWVLFSCSSICLLSSPSLSLARTAGSRGAACTVERRGGSGSCDSVELSCRPPHPHPSGRASSRRTRGPTPNH
jgi:hypothetical protein